LPQGSSLRSRLTSAYRYSSLDSALRASTLHTEQHSTAQNGTAACYMASCE
jgi:hypothetical protein